MNILVIGNGFDLAHKLPTRYNDFLGFVERFLNIINTPQILRQGELKNTEKTVYKYIDHLIFNEQQLCKELEQLVKDNIWIEYFLQNPMYQKENWIDFENEISKVIQSLDQDMFFKDGEKSELSEKMQNLSNPFLHKKYSKYTAAMRTASALTHGKGESITYKEIRDRLYNDLNKLIRALEIYLTDYVEKEECNCVLPDIQEIVKENVKGADGEEQIKYCKVLSFNYTNTYERLYLDKQLIQNSHREIHTPWLYPCWEILCILKKNRCDQAHYRAHDAANTNGNRISNKLRTIIWAHNRKCKHSCNLSDYKEF